MGNSASSSSSSIATNLPALQVASNCDTARFMGTWFVIGVKPTIFEKTCSNAVEKYTWLTKDDDKKDSNSKYGYDIDIDFQYNNYEDPLSATKKNPVKKMPQKGWIQGDDKHNSGLWKVSPVWPIKMPYLILEVDDIHYNYTIIGYPSREYCWIMSRHPIMDEEVYTKLTNLLVQKHQYDLTGLRKVPQLWTAMERTKRGLTEKEIPDSMLWKPEQQ